MINIFLFLGVTFFAIFLVGKVIEKLKVPWIFAALLIGFLLSIYNPFLNITSGRVFGFLATMGMYFLLFMIGFEINLSEIKKRTGFIIKSTIFIIFLETFFGGLLIHYIFDYSWIISIVVSMSFATVGEAILIPILDEFKITNKKLGQTIIGIGTFDDFIEISLLIFIIFLINPSGVGDYRYISLIIVSLFVLFALTVGFLSIGKKENKFSVHNLDSMFFIVLGILFLFLGIGESAESASLAALLAGISAKTFIPKKRIKFIEREIKAISYGFFAPLFFLWVGLSSDMRYLIRSPLLILLVVLFSSGAKILGSYIIAKKELGIKKSVLLGIGLSVRFSTSLVIIKLLLDNNLIKSDVYSVIIASSIIFAFLIPVIFSNLLKKWNIK